MNHLLTHQNNMLKFSSVAWLSSSPTEYFLWCATIKEKWLLWMILLTVRTFFLKKNIKKGGGEGRSIYCSVKLELISCKYYLLDIISKPSQKSRTFTSEIMAQFLQFTKSTSWSPNSRLKASGFQSSDFNFLWTPDTSTGWEYKDACLLHHNQVSLHMQPKFKR